MDVKRLNSSLRQSEIPPVKQHGFRFPARGFEHEIGPVRPSASAARSISAFCRRLAAQVDGFIAILPGLCSGGWHRFLSVCTMSVH